MTVRYGFDLDFARKTNQDPYFTITAEIYQVYPRSGDHAFGCLHKDIQKYFPDLVPLIKWHLCAAHFDGTKIIAVPMHYIENAIYWFEQMENCSEWERQEYDPDPKKAFYSTVIWPAFNGMLCQRLLFLIIIAKKQPFLKTKKTSRL